MTTVGKLTEANTSRKVEVGGLTIHYNESGQPHSDQAVIFLHGGGPGASGWSNFSRNIEAIAQHHRVVLMDSLGFGKSDPVIVKNESRTTLNARSVKGLMDSIGIEQVTLVGNSVGGATSLAFALDYPDRLAKMVLMGAGGDVTRYPHTFAHVPSEGIKVLQETYANPSIEGMRRLVNVMLYDGSTISDSLLQERYESLISNPAHTEARRQSDNTPRDLWAELTDAPSKIPSLIIHGRDDRINPLETSLRLLTILDNSWMVIFNKCGHWAQFEHADRFNRILLEFLAE